MEEVGPSEDIARDQMGTGLYRQLHQPPPSLNHYRMLAQLAREYLSDTSWKDIQVSRLPTRCIHTIAFTLHGTMIGDNKHAILGHIAKTND